MAEKSGRRVKRTNLHWFYLKVQNLWHKRVINSDEQATRTFYSESGSIDISMYGTVGWAKWFDDGEHCLIVRARSSCCRITGFYSRPKQNPGSHEIIWEHNEFLDRIQHSNKRAQISDGKSNGIPAYNECIRNWIINHRGNLVTVHFYPIISTSWGHFSCLGSGAARKVTGNCMETSGNVWGNRADDGGTSIRSVTWCPHLASCLVILDFVIWLWNRESLRKDQSTGFLRRSSTTGLSVFLSWHMKNEALLRLAWSGFEEWLETNHSEDLLKLNDTTSVVSELHQNICHITHNAAVTNKFCQTIIDLFLA